MYLRLSIFFIALSLFGGKSLSTTILGRNGPKTLNSGQRESSTVISVDGTPAFTGQQSYTEILNCTLEIVLNSEDLPTFRYFGRKDMFRLGAEMYIMSTQQFPRQQLDDFIGFIEQNSHCIETEIKSVNATKPFPLSRCVIVEPRSHPALKTVLSNVCNKLNCPITIFHGTENRELIDTLKSEISCLDRAVSLNITNLNTTSYNELLLSDEMFWSRLGTSDNNSILIFQTDSGICGDGEFVSKFLNYDYCGGLFHSLHVYNNGILVGNGGFSIRNVGTMRRLLRSHPDHRHHFYWEDSLFSHWCAMDPLCAVCPQDIANEFATTASPYEYRDANNNRIWAFHRNWKTEPNGTVDIHAFHSLCAFNSEVLSLCTNAKKDHLNIVEVLK